MLEVGAKCTLNSHQLESIWKWGKSEIKKIGEKKKISVSNSVIKQFLLN